MTGPALSGPSVLRPGVAAPIGFAPLIFGLIATLRWRPAAAARLLAVALLTMALPTMSGAALAQTEMVPPQILTLDQDRLYADSAYGKAMEAKALVISQALAAENRKIEVDLLAEEADLTQKRATMAVAGFQALADGFDVKVEKLRKDQAAKVDAVRAQRDAGRKTFFSAAVPVLAEMMHQMGAYAIVNRDALFLSFDSIDVTDRAIKAVDDKLGDGSALPLGPRAAVTDGTVQGPAPQTPPAIPTPVAP